MSNWVTEWLSDWVTEWLSDWVHLWGHSCAPHGIPGHCSVTAACSALWGRQQLQLEASKALVLREWDQEQWAPAELQHEWLGGGLLPRGRLPIAALYPGGRGGIFWLPSWPGALSHRALQDYTGGVLLVTKVHYLGIFRHLILSSPRRMLWSSSHFCCG